MFTSRTVMSTSTTHVSFCAVIWWYMVERKYFLYDTAHNKVCGCILYIYMYVFRVTFNCDQSNNTHLCCSRVV